MQGPYSKTQLSNQCQREVLNKLNGHPVQGDKHCGGPEAEARQEGHADNQGGAQKVQRVKETRSADSIPKRVCGAVKAFHGQCCKVQPLHLRRGF